MSTPAASTSSNNPPVIEARGLVKRYGQVTALDGADFELRAGEILAVIGDNGAGKSSLIKALSGATIPDEGEIRLDGHVIHFKSPIDARRAGIETVYQDLAVAPAMTIAENLFLGRELRRPGFLGSVLGMLDKKKMLEESIARMNDLKVGIRSMTQAVETLSGGQRQCVAVARAAAFARRGHGQGGASRHQPLALGGGCAASRRLHASRWHRRAVFECLAAGSVGRVSTPIVRWRFIRGRRTLCFL
jgi:fructose transport system ATP-binding protein